ncbi:hypothetical protein AWT69_001501 [Pseudomonas putida]|nr:hypothetical protein AWT69_001501 [Pseudomonas putida]
MTDEGQVQRGGSRKAGNASLDNVAGTEVPAHCVDRDDLSGQGLLVGALVDHFATTVYAFWRYVVTQVYFTGALLYRQSFCRQGVVRTAHVTGRAGFFVLLNSHN